MKDLQDNIYVWRQKIVNAKAEIEQIHIKLDGIYEEERREDKK